MPDLHDCPSRYIMKCASGIRHRLDASVEDIALTTNEARALQFIAASEGTVRQRDLEQEYGLSAATISELMQNMEAKGLIRRETDPEDRRRKRLIIPEAMRSRADAMLDQMADMEAQLARNIDPAKLQVFMEVIEQMSRNLPPHNR